MTSEFVVSDLQSLADLENTKALSVPQLAENYLRTDLQGTPDKNISNAIPGAVGLGSPDSGGAKSWLQKCTSKIFVFSASKKNKLASPDQNMSRRLHVEASPKKLSTEVMSELPFGVAADASDMQNMQLNNSNRGVGSGLDLFDGTNGACRSQDGDADTENQLVSDMVLSEEVNGTPEQSREYQNQGGRSGADGEDEVGDKVEHPGEVSMSKKVWKFLLT